jgi:dolichol-phosphate mannosyltransferase
MANLIPDTTREKQNGQYHAEMERNGHRHIHGFTTIPTDDPEAALRFCRSLAQVFATNSSTFLFQQPHVSDTQTIVQHETAHQAESKTPDLSVVLPVYNEQENLPLLYERLTSVLTATGLDYEIIFVDDGSKDKSVAYLHATAANDSRLVIVELARNFGHQVAISAGLEHTRGRGVIVMDSDLQDPPEALPQFIEKWQQGYEVVYAIRAKRKENVLKRGAYSLFYRLLQKVSHIEIPLDSGDFCIMDRRVVDELHRMPERNRFVRGIRSWVGFRQIGLEYERHARHAGKPKYTLNRLIHLALDGIISFSYLPLKMITMMGFGISFLSIVIALFYTIKALTVGLYPPGFATTIVSIFLLAGIQLITVGVIGEYVGRIFEEVKGRPLYIVRKVTHHTHQ